jgi:peptidoglycan/LPS O-acetylase OafA/YrhL
MKLKYYKELDGVRAIAAVMVMIFHYFATVGGNSNLLVQVKKIAAIGQTGVSLFFVLSGFLITRILMASRQAPNFFSNFYIRRSLRIFPLYFLFLVIYFFIVPTFLQTRTIPFAEQKYFWVYLQNFAMTFNWQSDGPEHFWSLAVEEHFYLFWPLVIYFLTNKKVVYFIIFIILLAIIVRVGLLHNGLETFYFTFARMDELAIGALLAILEIKNLLNTKNNKKILLGLLIVAVPSLLLWPYFSGSSNAMMQVVKYLLLSVTYFFTIAYIISTKEQNLLKRLLKTKPFSYTGKISYGLYVYHPLCFLICTKYFTTNNFFVNIGVAFLFAYIIATISFYFIEAQFLKFKAKFSS